MLYGISMDEDQFEEIALIGWNLIGNKRVRLYRYIVEVNDCNKEVELPCGVIDIEAVTLGDVEEWAYSTNDTPNGDLESAFTEHYIEHRKSFRHPMYIQGKYVKYERVGDKLYFDRPYGRVFILYKGEIVDEEGLPQITDKEARALATYCAWITKYKEAMTTNNPQLLTLATSLQQQWLIQCDQARVDRYLSQNEWDQILDVRASHTRKQYGRSLKIYQ